MRNFSCVLCLVLIFFPASVFAKSSIFQNNSNKPFSHAVWDQFLKEFVNEKGEVDYAGVKKNPALLDLYLEQVAFVKQREILTSQNWPREETIALYLNVYHAALIREIKNRYPIRTVNQIQGLWDMENVRIGKNATSLNKIRRSLVSTFRDEKIHAALSCGAVSCPRLRQEAYQGPSVEGQLLLAVKEFVNDPVKNKMIPGRNKIELSKIFDWHKKDFLLDFGVPDYERNVSPEEYSVLSFLAYYLDDPDQITYLEEGEYKIKYLPFDWTLNDWVRNS